MQETYKELTREDIHEYFELYKKHVDKISSHEESLYIETDREKWVENYIARSNAIREAYVDNTRINAELEIYFSDHLPLTDEIADALYDELMALPVDTYDDPFYAVKLCNNLIDVYRERNDLNRLIRLYNRLGYESQLAMIVGYKEYGKLAYDTYLKIIAQRDKYASFDDFETRRTFFVAYYNIICLMPTHGIITVDKAFRFFEEEIDFFYSPKVRDLDSDNPELDMIMGITKTRILRFENIIPEADESTKLAFCRLAKKVYEEECNNTGSEYQIGYEALLAYYRAQVLEHRMSYSDAIEYLLIYYRKRKQMLKAETVGRNFRRSKEYYFQTSFPETMITIWLKDRRVSQETRDNTIKELIHSEKEYFNQITRAKDVHLINRDLTYFTFLTLNLLESKEAKEAAVLDVILERQIQTFFHSYMVADLSVMIAKSILENKPSLLKAMYPGEEEENIRNKSVEILEFVKKAALFHDIGKNRITTVINMQYRRLFDEEFELIKKHPAIGADSVDEDFDAYHDVILGHHKFYDCTKGYPERYNPSESKVKTVIDIISICDSLDAGTDYYGRNYSTRKYFSDVLGELREGAGTRYNPDIVDLFDKDPALSESIDNLLTKNREYRYFELVKTHLQN